MKCKRCDTVNEHDSIFCKKCGKKIELNTYCVKCNKKLNDDEIFCTQCGIENVEVIDLESNNKKNAGVALLIIVVITLFLSFITFAVNNI